MLLIDFLAPNYFHVNLSIDENLPNYFEALEEVDRNTMIAEEENMRKTYVSFNLTFLEN